MWDVVPTSPYTDVVVLKGRQIGLSWAAGALVVWAGCMHENWEILVVSMIEDQAKRILGYAKNFAERIRKLGLYKFFIEGQSGKTVRFQNRSIATAVGCTKPDANNVRNYTADLLIVDEEALIYDKMFSAITPTTAHTGGKILHISTAGSIGSFFYRMWKQGEDANRWRGDLAEGREIPVTPEDIPPIKSYTIPSTDCDDMTQATLDRERRKLGEIRFNREYLCVWAGTADQVFTHIPLFRESRRVVRTKRPTYAGIDVGRINDPTELVIIEDFQQELTSFMGEIPQTVLVPFRIIYMKAWEREDATTIANDIYRNVHPRFNSRLYTIDCTGGYGEDLLNRMTELEIPVRGMKVKQKQKNDLTFDLDDALKLEQLWINDHPSDIDAEELRFQLAGYIGRSTATGYYTFDTTVGRDHKVDGLKLAWSSIAAGSLEPIIDIRKRR